MLKSFKYRIYPNSTQKILLNKTFGSNRFIWNQMLNERISVYAVLKDNKESLYSYKYLTEAQYKIQFEFLKEVDSISLQQTRLNLNNAYKSFYRRLKSKDEKAGFPKFKSKKNNQSFRIVNTNNNLKIDTDNKKIKLPKLGWIKYSDNRIINTSIRSITVSKNTSDEYFISILTNTEYSNKTKPQIINNIISMDMSANSFIVSEERQFTNEKFYRKTESKLSKLQKSISRKQLKSNNRNKYRLKLSKLNNKMLNRKNDWMHKLSKLIVDDYDGIFIEDLDIKQMQQYSSGLSKTITLDFSWGEFVRQLEYKSLWYGKHLIKVGRYYPSSQLCNDCGYKNSELKLSDREWVCPECGCIHDRDINASRNIKEEGIRLLSEEYPNIKINTVGTTEINACENMITTLVESVQESTIL